MTATPFFVENGSIPKLVIPDETWNIYGYQSNINHFLTTPLVGQEQQAVEAKTGNKKAHTRRKYVGDTAPSNVSAHTFDYIKDPSRKTGTALPGWSFILVYDGEKRQFTTTATVAQLHTWLYANVKGKTFLYTQGARYEIDPTEMNEGV